MRLPNGYGSVIYLGKKRRNPYAVRVLTGYRKNKKGTSTPTYNYLGYFPRKTEALTFLGLYNANKDDSLDITNKNNIAYSFNRNKSTHGSMISNNKNQITFALCYEELTEYLKRLKKSPAESSMRNLRFAYDKLSALHDMPMDEITTIDIENAVKSYSDKSKSTINAIKTLLIKTYRYALKQKYVTENAYDLADFEYSDEKVIVRKEIPTDELNLLWSNMDTPYVDIILIMIYTGVRANELLITENINVHLQERYFITGSKTASGKNRTIPIHKKILPLFRKYYSLENKYLISNPSGGKYSYPWFHAFIWTPVMSELQLEHTPHDTRHTLKSILDRSNANKICVDMIMGHKVKNSNDRTYIHKTLSDLIEAIDMIE